MSKITFGYSSNEIRDLFSDSPLRIKALLLDIRNSMPIKVLAQYTKDWDDPCLRIQLEADDCSDLEKAIQLIVDKEGLPSIIDQPDPPKTKLSKIKEFFSGKYYNKSTLAPYNYLMALYEKNGQKRPKTGFVNHTARAEAFSYHV